MTTNIFITTHANKRFSERSHYLPQHRLDVTIKAFNKGYEMTKFKDPLFSYLKSLAYNSNGRYEAKIYENYIFIFNNANGHRLLTIYKVPEEYLPVEQYMTSSGGDNPCYIALTSKNTGEITYWGEFGESDDILEAIEFKNKAKALNYIHNNHQLDDKKLDYDIEII